MLSKEAVLAAVEKWDSWEGAFLDGRDRHRLAGFFHQSDWPRLGLRPIEGAKPSDVGEPLPWTEEGIREQLAHDVAFAFDKALNKRSISASLMRAVVLMWLWVLEDPLGVEHKANEDELYPQYGLPLLKAVAVKYGFPNPIGNDIGNEFKYSAEYEDEPA